MKYQIIICDDEKLIAHNIASQIKIAWENIQDENDRFRNKNLEISLIAQSFEEVVEYIKKKDTKNGIYFLDIEIGKEENSENGVELAKWIKSKDSNAQIVFVTAYDKYAPLTYERRIGAIDYINKNQTSENLINRLTSTLVDCLDRVEENMNQVKQYFLFRRGRFFQKIKIDDIFFIESGFSQHKVNLVFSDGESEFSENISQLDKKMIF